MDEFRFVALLHTCRSMEFNGAQPSCFALLPEADPRLLVRVNLLGQEPILWPIFFPKYLPYEIEKILGSHPRTATDCN